jgi:hypothetical protein
LDIIVGEWHGNLNHFEQTTAGSKNFVLVSDTLGNFGNFSHFEQTAADSNDFIIRNLYMIENDDLIYGGSSPCFIDIEGDGLFDLFVGEMDGLYYTDFWT